MTERTTEAKAVSSPCFDNLEEWLRGKMQETLQVLLEEEVTEFLGRMRSQRRAAVDAPSGYRNGYGKPRRLTLSNGTIRVRRPRVRDTKEPFESRLLPMFSRRSRQVGELLPELYLHGLAEGDFDLALRGLLGQEAPLSASTVARLKEKWQAEMVQWSQRSLADLEVVYLWVDGIYVKAGLEKDRAAVLVVLGALSDGRKVVLTVVPGHRESSQSWSAVLRDLKSRGLGCPRLVAGDGHLGIWGALGNVYPEAEQQRCWNHKMLNILDKLPKRLHSAAKPLLSRIVYAPGQEQAEAAKREFQRWCRQQSQEAAAECLDRDWDRLITFYRFPEAHWRHLRTTNPIESPFAALRLRTDAARRYKKVANATTVLWKLLLVAEKTFRRLNAPEQLKEVFLGAQFVDGVRVQNRFEEEKAA